MNYWYDRAISFLVTGTEYEFMKCNKTILEDNSDDLNTTFTKLSQTVVESKNVRVSTGKDGIVTRSWGIYVLNRKFDNGLLASRVSHLISSGIPRQYKEMERADLVKYVSLKEVKSRQPSRLNLNINILTLFSVYAVGISMSILCLSMESFSIFF